MKKIIIIAAIVLFAVGIYLSATDAPQVGGDEYTTEEKSQSVGSTIKNTFRNFIPGSESTPQKLPESPHVVVINSIPQHIEMEDAIDRIESQKDLKDNEAIDFASWCVLSDNAKYSADEREQILERAAEILKPNDRNLLLRDAVLRGKEKNVQEKAVSLIGQGMDKAQLEAFVTEVLHRYPQASGKAALIEYAATKNIYVK